MVDADNISFVESIIISAMTASTPYSGSPIFVVMDMALTVAEDETAALVVAADTVVDEITLVSIFYSHHSMK
jgi:hypothetical protein